MANKSTKSIVRVGLDIGYGYTKLVAEDDRVVVFPSVLGYAHEIKYKADEILSKYKGDLLTDDSATWFVGELALAQLPPGQIMVLAGRDADDAMALRQRLMKAALGKLFTGLHGDVVHLHIATGLPVDHMRDAQCLRDALLGQHYIRTDATELVANVVRVQVMPQPYGTIYARQLTSTGGLDPCYTHKVTGVADLGRFTFDLTVDDDGEYIDYRSGSNEGGTFLAEQALAAVIQRDFRFQPGPKIVSEVLRTKCLRIRGTPIDYSSEVATALNPLREGALNFMRAKWGNADDIDVIFLTGGGAPLIYDLVKAAYPHAQMVSDASQLDNAKGFRNYALFSAG